MRSAEAATRQMGLGRTGSRSNARTLGLVALVALAYYLSARLGLAFELVGDQVTPLWPPTGIALAAMLLFGPKVWPGIAIGAFAVNAPLGPTIPAALGIAAGNTLAPAIAYLLLRRFDFHAEMDRLRDALALVFAAGLGAMTISAGIGTSILVASGAVDAGAFWTTWSVWWTGDALGVLVFAPTVLVLRTLRQTRARPAPRAAEATLVIMLQSAVATLAVASALPALFLVFPPLIWGAWRFQQRGAAPGVLVITSIATLGASSAAGPFGEVSLLQKMIILQSFNGTVALTAFLLAAMTLERIRAGVALERSGQLMEARVIERTAELAATVAQLENSEARLEEAQRVASIGSWEWDMTTNAVTWTDELFRLNGLEPGSVDVTYEVFIERVHPEDRVTIDAAIRRATEDHEPFVFDHRVIWPDGQIRWIHGRGTVTTDEAGTPVKMSGTGQDITARVLADVESRTSEHRFRTLIASAPDAVVCVDASGAIVLVNEQARKLFGYEQDELLGRPLEDLLPEHLREQHQHHRAGYIHNPRTRPMGAGLQLSAKRKDGSEFPVDISLSSVETSEGAMVTAFVRDVTERRRAEETALELRETALRHRQAFEINDTIVQGLASAVYALDTGDIRGAGAAVQHTLGTARQMMAKLVGDDTAFQPGALARDTPATVAPENGDDDEAAVGDRLGGGQIRVVIADDTPDIRLVLRNTLRFANGISLVGEAADGLEAVRLVEQLDPDVLILDLAMPVMDGLEALKLVTARAPRTKVIVLSGFGKEQAADQALQLGAAAYVEKGGSLGRIATLIRELVPTSHLASDAPSEQRATTIASATPLDEDRDLIGVYVHELRNPLTALMGLAETLIHRADVISGERVVEMHEAMLRSAQQLNTLVDALGDAARTGSESLTLRSTDVVGLVRVAAAEAEAREPARPITITGDDATTAAVDPSRISQVLSNLLSNAAKFSDPGSPIELRVLSHDDKVDIEVRDRGVGIPEDKRSLLFEKFQRLGTTRPGAGLGLYTSRRIARAHGGDLTLRRSGPDGSTFVLTLPTAQRVSRSA